MVDGLVPVETKVLSVTLVLDELPILVNEPEVECGLLVTGRVVPRLEFARGLEELKGIFVRIEVGFFVVVTGRFVITVVLMVAGLLVLLTVLTGFLTVA